MFANRPTQREVFAAVYAVRSPGASAAAQDKGGQGGSTVRIVGYVLTTSWEGCVYVPSRSSPPPPQGESIMCTVRGQYCARPSEQARY
jgi:hypothetical protein